jgi:hypothetical protein
MTANARITFAQNRLDAARREIKQAVIDFSVPDENLLALRANAREAYQELKALDRKTLRKGLLSLIKFW